MLGTKKNFRVALCRLLPPPAGAQFKNPSKMSLKSKSMDGDWTAAVHLEAGSRFRSWEHRPDKTPTAAHWAAWQLDYR